MREIGPDAVNSLAEKLAAMDLTEDEQHVLGRMVDRAGLYEPEVSGFTDRYSGLDSGADLSKIGFRLGAGAGFFPGKPSFTEFSTEFTEFRSRGL